MQRLENKVKREMHELEKKVLEVAQIASVIDAKQDAIWHHFNDEKQSVQTSASRTSKENNTADVESNIEFKRLLITAH